MTDRSAFEARLQARLTAHAAVADRPVDAARIAADAAATAGTRRRTSWLAGRGLAAPRLVGATALWLALVALVVTLIGVGLLVGSRPTLPAVVEPRPSPSGEPAIAILPGEPWLVYPTPGGDRTGGGLILVREDGSDRHEILARPGLRLDHPDWSRDGTRLAFDAWRPDEADPDLDRIDLWVADADGANARQVTTCERPCLQRSYPAWSPDGTELALIRYDLAEDGTWGRTAVEVLDLASGAIREVATTADGVSTYFTPRWSPDGSRIVFGVETFTDAAQETLVSAVLATVEADGPAGAEPRILSPPDLVARYPDWHPSDDRIVFEASAVGSGASTTDLYVIRADGSGLTDLTTFRGGEGARMPTWTPDGRRIVYSQQTASPAMTAAFMAADGSDRTLVSLDLAAALRLRPTP